MSYTNHNILPRALSYEEKENRKKGIYDSFANYLVYCPKCKHVAKTIKEMLIIQNFKVFSHRN